MDSIWINEEGEIKVADFVLRQTIREHAGDDFITKILNPDYFRDLKNSSINEKTDLYSLGACLYKILTGNFPEDNSHKLTNLELETPDYFNAAVQSLIDDEIETFEEFLGKISKLKVNQNKPLKVSHKTEPRIIMSQPKNSETQRVSGESRRLSQQKLRSAQNQLTVMRLLLIISIIFLSIFFGSRYLSDTGFGKASEKVLNNTLDKAFLGEKEELDVNELLNQQ